VEVKFLHFEPRYTCVHTARTSKFAHKMSIKRPNCTCLSSTWDKALCLRALLPVVNIYFAGVIIRVARWFVFKPKIPIWVNFGGSCYGKSWYILWPFGLFYGHWKYFMAIRYILWYFGIFFPVLVFWTKKNLASLVIIMKMGHSVDNRACAWLRTGWPDEFLKELPKI
jgi:hypothetical protein